MSRNARDKKTSETRDPKRPRDPKTVSVIGRWSIFYSLFII